MTSNTCQDCCENTTLSTEQCLACPRFAKLFMPRQIDQLDGDEQTAPMFPVMQMLAVCIGGIGFIAAISEMPIVAGGMIFFALGLCLADYLGAH